MSMEFMGSFLKGYTGDLEEQRKRNADEADAQAKRDEALFNTLANSDDPDIRAAAVTGLLTKNHPARFFDKLYGKVSTHPAYEQIKSLVANGHQPFQGATEETRRRTQAQTEGQYGGRIDAIKHSGIFKPEELPGVVRGMFGAATRNQGPQRGTLKLADGSTVGGYFDPETRQYFDDDGQPRHDVSAFSASGNFQATRNTPTGVGGAWKNMTLGQWRQLYGDPGQEFQGVPDSTLVSARVSADGSQAGLPTFTAPPPANPNFTFVPTDQGYMAGNTREGTLKAPGGAAGRVMAPVSPVSAAASVRNIYSDIVRLHPSPKGIMPGVPATKQAQAAWQQAVDTEARKYGYPSFAALQQAVAEETQNVQAATPTAPARTTPPPPAVPGQGARPAAPPAAPGRQGRGAAPAPPADPLSGNDPEFVNRVMRELQR